MCDAGLGGGFGELRADAVEGLERELERAGARPVDRGGEECSRG